MLDKKDRATQHTEEFNEAREGEELTSMQSHGPAPPVPSRIYEGMFQAYDFFNPRFFNGDLPPCLLTLQRSRTAKGFFAAGRFVDVNDPRIVIDEIALNPAWLTEDLRDALGTLVHEMVHCQQRCLGKGSLGPYHNKAWAEKMVEVGLIPSDTGAPGGKKTGNRISHYVREGGPFDLACAEFLQSNAAVLFKDKRQDTDNDGKVKKRRKRQAASKTKFTCARCEANAWGKPDLKLVCQPCDEVMQPPEADPFEENGITDGE